MDTNEAIIRLKNTVDETKRNTPTKPNKPNQRHQLSIKLQVLLIFSTGNTIKYFLNLFLLRKSTTLDVLPEVSEPLHVTI